MYVNINIYVFICKHRSWVVTNCRLHFTMIFARYCSHLCHFLIHELNCFVTDSMQRIRPIDTSADPAVWMMTEGRWSLFNLLRSLIKTVESGNTRRFNKISSYKFTWCPKQPFLLNRCWVKHPFSMSWLGLSSNWNAHFNSWLAIRFHSISSSHLFIMACEVRINC